MAIVIGVAWYAVSATGGMHTLLARLAEARAQAGPAAGDATSFFPDFSRPITSEALWTLPVLTFLVNIGLQWWAFWYPGAEPGGGGYIAQRIFAARDERNGLLSVLWFNIAHYALRPWPWILTALSAIVLYPRLEHPENGYMLIVSQHVPVALRGIVVAGFMAAFMSTIATQLNWGASYLVADFYRRFIKRDGSEKHYVNISRLATVLLVVASAYVSAQLASIRSGWEFVLEVGAGTGGVYLLRWYWWRINAWSEISAMATALVASVFLRWVAPFAGSSPAVFAKTALTTTAATSLVWIVVTLATSPEPAAKLTSFYRAVRPHAAGWQPIARLAPEVPETRDLGRNLVSWILGCAMVYLALFGAGHILIGPWGEGMLLLGGSAICAMALYFNLARQGWESEILPAGTRPDYSTTTE
jgi:Na+/proline symporter